MRECVWGILLISCILITGCAKNETNPVIPEDKGSVTGIVKNSMTNQAVYGIKITIMPDSITVSTDANGRYSFSGIKTGTYYIVIKDSSYEYLSLGNVVVTTGNTTTMDASVMPLVWGGAISGIVRNSMTGLPVLGIKVLNTKDFSVSITDANGAYKFKNLNAGSYGVTINDPGYKSFSASNIVVVTGNVANVNILIAPFTWGTWKSDNGATIAVPFSLDPKIDGVPLSSGDLVGVFYDSLGLNSCNGYSTWTGKSNIAISVWGDITSTTTRKEGFVKGEFFIWKVKRISDGKVFAATATYKSSNGSYVSNGLYEVESLTITTD